MSPSVGGAGSAGRQSLGEVPLGSSEIKLSDRSRAQEARSSNAGAGIEPRSLLLQYVAGLLEAVPMLARMVESRTAETIRLTNRVVVEVHTASWRTLRGHTLAGAI